MKGVALKNNDRRIQEAKDLRHKDGARVRTGTQQAKTMRIQRGGAVTALAFSAHSRYLAVGSEDMSSLVVAQHSSRSNAAAEADG